MARILAGVAAFILVVTGAILFWRGSPSESALPPAPAATGQPSMIASPPEASPKSREERRFSRADKD